MTSAEVTAAVAEADDDDEKEEHHHENAEMNADANTNLNMNASTTQSTRTTDESNKQLIQELRRLNESLTSENEHLRNRLTALESRLAAEQQSMPALPPISDDTILNVVILGGGSFGTALATIAARKGHNVMILVRDAAQARGINEEHINGKREWLRKHVLPHNIRATTDITVAIHPHCTHLIINCIPTQATPDFLSANAQHIPPHIMFVNTAKGIHLESEKLLSELIPQCLRREHAQTERLAYLSGPSFAKEMMCAHPISLVVAAHNRQWCTFVQRALNSLRFRIYISTDVIGVECGGALKNPVAIGAGLAHGLGYGQSTLAALVTRGTVEMQRLAVCMGGRPETLIGLSGYGDLMLTCFSSMSRNRTCGYFMAKHQLSAADAQAKVGETVEGVATAIVTQKLIRKYRLRMPLFDALANVLQGKLAATNALKLVAAEQPNEEGFILVMPQPLPLAQTQVTRAHAHAQPQAPAQTQSSNSNNSANYSAANTAGATAGKTKTKTNKNNNNSDSGSENNISITKELDSIIHTLHL